MRGFLKCEEEGYGGELEIIFVICILVNGRYDQSARYCKNFRKVYWSDCTPVLNKEGKKAFLSPTQRIKLNNDHEGFYKNG